MVSTKQKKLSGKILKEITTTSIESLADIYAKLKKSNTSKKNTKRFGIGDIAYHIDNRICSILNMNKIYDIIIYNEDHTKSSKVLISSDKLKLIEDLSRSIKRNTSDVLYDIIIYKLENNRKQMQKKHKTTEPKANNYMYP